MTMQAVHLTLPLFLALCISSIQAKADAKTDTEGRASTVFFSLNLGPSAGWISHPEIKKNGQLGLEYDAAFGLGLTRRWAIGFELSTWSPPNIDGNPSHLHLFAPRVEYTVGEKDGLVLAAAAGLALADGSAVKSLGFGIMSQMGYRVPLSKLITLAPQFGTHVAIHEDGGYALAPFAAVELRFWGHTGLRL